MTTPADIIQLAFRNSGILSLGQTLYAEDMYNALGLCNMMLSQWQRKRWLAWHLVTTAKTSTGATSYTVGALGDFNIARPDRIEAAFLRQLNVTPAVDYPLQLIEAREDYNRITLKTLTSFPQYLFYDSDYPTGVVYPWPVPQSALYAVHITTKAVLSQFTSLTQTLSLPEEFHAAILYNLAMRLRPAYKLPQDDTIARMAGEALNVIRGANAQIPRLQMPDALVTQGHYDIYSDRA